MPVVEWKPAKVKQSRHDPYSDWFAGVGADFAVSSREPKDDRDDFTWEFEHKEHNGYKLVAGRSELGSRGFGAPLRKDSIFPPADPKADQIRELRNYPSTADPGAIEAIVAVIDDGVNFGHVNFRNTDDSSRVAFAWVQDGVMQKTSWVPYGREWTRPNINKALDAAGNNPDKLLQELDLVNFARTGIRTVTRRASHGTHMTDLATGYSNSTPRIQNRALPVSDVSKGIDPEKIAIITVQLPFLMTQETSGATYEAFAAQALDYVLRRARSLEKKIDKNLPVIINFSYAIGGGPHDGSSPLDQEIIRILDAHNVRPENSDTRVNGEAILLLPSGNRYMERGHAQFPISKEEPVTNELPWRVLPGDQTSSFLEIWMPHDAIGKIKISSPSSPEFAYVIGEEVEANVGGDTIARVTTDIPTSCRRKRVLIALAPTDTYWMPIGNRRKSAPVGIWTVALEITTNEESGWIDAWIQRDDSPYRYRANAKQSYFDDPAYVRFDARGDVAQADLGQSTVRREGSLSGMATINNDYIRVVGGLRGDQTGQRIPAHYSAEGFSDGSARGGNDSPHTAQVTDDSRILPGVLSAGTASGSTVSFIGTSSAAPQVARQLAEQIVDMRKNNQPEVANGEILPAWNAIFGPIRNLALRDTRIGIGAEGQ